jgi:hypothetical protein
LKNNLDYSKLFSFHGAAEPDIKPPPPIYRDRDWFDHSRFVPGFDTTPFPRHEGISPLGSKY